MSLLGEPRAIESRKACWSSGAVVAPTRSRGPAAPGSDVLGPICLLETGQLLERLLGSCCCAHLVVPFLASANSFWRCCSFQACAKQVDSN